VVTIRFSVLFLALRVLAALSLITSLVWAAPKEPPAVTEARELYQQGVSAYDRIVVVSAAAGRPTTGPAALPSPQPVRRLPSPIVQPAIEADDPTELEEVDADDPRLLRLGRLPSGAEGQRLPPGRSPPTPSRRRRHDTGAGQPFGAVQVVASGQIAPVPPPAPGTPSGTTGERQNGQ
jgi:hypothetical protein